MFAKPTMFAKPHGGRTTAAAEGDLVVFLIGMRINHFWAPHHWLPVLTAMPRMLRELRADEQSGLLGYQLLTGSPRTYYVVQYWRSKEQLLKYAIDPARLHRKAWAMGNRMERKSGRHVGIWHETYPCRRATTSPSTATCRPTAWPPRPACSRSPAAAPPRRNASTGSGRHERARVKKPA